MIEELLGRIVGLGAASGRAPALRLALEPIVLEADQMVPLSFLLHEAVTNALKHMAGIRGNDNWLSVELVVAADESTGEQSGPTPAAVVVLRLCNPLRDQALDASSRKEGDIAADESPGLGTELIEAFTLQLGGPCRQKMRETAEARRSGNWKCALRQPQRARRHPLPPRRRQVPQQGTDAGLSRRVLPKTVGWVDGCGAILRHAGPPTREAGKPRLRAAGPVRPVSSPSVTLGRMAARSMTLCSARTARSVSF